MEFEGNLEDILTWYSEYLRSKHLKNSKRFERTRKLDLEAAIAEAITFHLLTYIGVGPEINEDVATGGLDFICCASRAPLFKRLPQNEFVVEATSLSPDAVSERSRIPKVIPKGISGGAIGLVTQLKLRHEGFAGAAQAAISHGEGWKRVMGWLVAYVEKGQTVDTRQ